MNNKGFTLIELLAVLVILIAIMSIAIPAISSSMERTKSKQDDEKKKILASYAELYVTDYKNIIYKGLNESGKNSCIISISELKLKDYVNEEGIKGSDGAEFNGYIKYTRPIQETDNTASAKYEYVENREANLDDCVNQ